MARVGRPVRTGRTDWPFVAVRSKINGGDAWEHQGEVKRLTEWWLVDVDARKEALRGGVVGAKEEDVDEARCRVGSGRWRFNGLVASRGGFGCGGSGGGGRWHEISPERSSRAKNRAAAAFRCLRCKRNGREAKWDWGHARRAERE